MADQKWSQFPDASLPLSGSEIMAIAIANSSNGKVTVQDFINSIFNNTISFHPAIINLLSDDELTLTDSFGSFIFLDNSGNITISTGTLNLQCALAVYGGTPYNGSLASAISAGANVINGLICT